MKWPPERAGAFGGARSQLPNCSCEQMLRQIQSLRVIQVPFGFVFWFLEQKIARLADELERRRA